MSGCRRALPTLPGEAWTRVSTTAEAEDDIDLRFYLHRLAIEQVGSVAPGLHCFHRGLLKHRRTTKDVEIFDCATLGNGCLKYNRSLDSGCFGNRRILRGHAAKFVAGDH